VPYALLSSGVVGDIQTDTAKLIIDGQPGFPPELIIKDHSSVTPTIDEYLRITDLKVSLIVDRSPGDVDKTEITADAFKLYYPSGVEAISFAPGAVVFNGTPVDFDGTEAQFLASDYKTTVAPDHIQLEAPIPLPAPIPAPLDSPYICVALADDVLNQIFASLVTPGNIKAVEYLTSPSLELARSCEIDANRIKFSTVDNDAEIRRVGNIIEIYPPSLSGAGLDLGGIVTFTNPKMVSLAIDTKVTHDFGGISEYLGVSKQLKLSSDEMICEPASGGAGPRSILRFDEVILTDDVPTATLRLHRSDGLTLDLASGHSTYYRADGVQLTGPDASRFGATHRGFSLTRPSGNGAFVCKLDDATDVAFCDLNDDGIRDVSFQSIPVPALVCRPSARLICEATATFENSMTIDVNDDGTVDFRCDAPVAGPRVLVDAGTEMRCEGPAYCEATLECWGTMKCKSGWTCDVNNDAITDVLIVAAPAPELQVAPTTRFACDGMATFAQPVQVNSSLTVNGSLLVTGPKAFVQDHPEDATKEIVYVALEGNESGTYTRGSSQLKNGVAEISLPEDFHLVTNVDGLTVQITPRGPVNSMLYVESVTPTMLVVKSSNKKDENVKFDFMVNGVRKGFENHQVIRDKKSLALNE